MEWLCYDGMCKICIRVEGRFGIRIGSVGNLCVFLLLLMMLLVSVFDCVVRWRGILGDS